MTTREKTHWFDRQLFPSDSLRQDIQDRLSSWESDHVTERLWNNDPQLWFEEPTDEITNRLHWLNLPDGMLDELPTLYKQFHALEPTQLTDVVLLGMGGSSLAADVFHRIFDVPPSYPHFRVLDTTHPDAVTDIKESIQPEHTLFIVASKSGTTTETRALFHYFWNVMQSSTTTPEQHFIATTDPESPLEQLALDRNFHQVFRAPEEVGGRYSALSHFGLVPAYFIGMNVERLLHRAAGFAETCRQPAPKNPALQLGAALGELVRHGKDKLTFLPSDSLDAFPDWLEQLVAESTGKDGTGIIPVVHEPVMSPDQYRDDRVFVSICLKEEFDQQKERIQPLQEAGHPVLSFQLDDRYDLSREMFRWEMAVAMAGSILKIHPFNQPDVELTKTLTRNAVNEPDGNDTSATDTIDVSSHPEVAIERIVSFLKDHPSAEYLALQAFLNPFDTRREKLQQFRELLQLRTPLATTCNFGPRFLHSTGQLHKGGPNTGLFVQLIDQPDTTQPVPETSYDFRKLIRAQTNGDDRALRQQGRSVCRLNLGHQPQESLQKLIDVFRTFDEKT